MDDESKRPLKPAKGETMKDEDMARINTAIPDSESTKFPTAVSFIIGNEFCERFSFYGMKAILPLYLTAWLGFTENRATTVIHTFNFSAYFFTLFGGIISDSYLGKYKTILYLSLIYCFGSVVLAVTSFPGISGTWGMFLGLILIGFGTGGIKPCVSAFGGDQFHPSQVAAIAVYFSVFYFAINAGSVLSMFITPILRQNVHCFGQDSCYPLAFGLPAVLMLVATVVFVIGSKMYVKTPPSGNTVVEVMKITWSAMKNWTVALMKRSRRGQASLLDYASGDYTVQFKREVRVLYAILAVFAPISLFWALYDQQGSRWTYQALMMDCSLGPVTIKPEQMGVINAILILVLIPVFDRMIYPLMARLRLPVSPLAKIFVGMVLGVGSFIMAAALQFIMDSQGTFIPSPEDPATRICTAGCVHVLWQVPQYFIITCAEVMLSITGLEFAYSQAPASMKSVCSAAWLLSVALGNLVVIFFNEIDPVAWFHAAADNWMAWNFVFWAVILALGCVWFAVIAVTYEYQNDPQPELFTVSENVNENLKINDL